MDEKYFWWVRIFDWQPDQFTEQKEEDIEWYNKGKGIKLDEFYLILDTNSKEDAKKAVVEKYNQSPIKFAKPRTGNGIYALIKESSKSWYDRFTNVIDTYCINDRCHKRIIGPAAKFPRVNNDVYDNSMGFYCSYDCKHHVEDRMRFEGEFQEKTVGESGIIGYIYHMYNRKENKHYIGQTRFMPFFRWQEHLKYSNKGDICDIVFDVISKVNSKRGYTESENQEYLNNIEAWWINKYKEEGCEVYNCTIPKLSIEYLHRAFEDMLAKEQQLKLL